MARRWLEPAESASGFDGVVRRFAKFGQVASTELTYAFYGNFGHR
jgi:hypothetical protein